MTVSRLRAVMGIATRAAARPGQRRLVHLCAVLIGAEIGLGDQAGRHRRPAPPPGRHVSLSERHTMLPLDENASSGPPIEQQID
jgi:hypothetical protein